MKTKYMPLIVGMILVLASAMAVAQPCVPSYPQVIPVGTSSCFQVCPGTYINIILEGNQLGPTAVPVLTMSPGCQWAQRCDVVCTAIDPPAQLQFGGDPYFPNDWYGETDCIIIYMHWVHDNIWSFEVFSFCQGCFCVTFDYQLAAQLAGGLTAESGDNLVTLNWTTASEVQNDYFEIDRDGAKIAEVPATNEASGSPYSYTDQTVVNGREYSYRLIAVDLAGTRQELDHISAVPTSANAVVTAYALHQNYPNPFNPETSIDFDVVNSGVAKLAIYNVLGETVTTLVNGPVQAGRHTVVFNGANLPSGVYLYKLQVNGFTDVKKLVLLK